MALYTQTGSLQTYDAVEAAGPGVLVPDAQLLFTGEYSRAGSDLVLTGSDGAKFHVTGYFNTDTPPSLVSPDGAKLPGDVVMSLAGPQFPGQYAQAGDAASGKAAIGKVESSSGSASAVRTDGTTVVLKAGDPVFQGDVVLTGPGSKLGISFVDGTIFSLSANARMVLNSLVYDPDAGQNNSMLFSLVEGSFVFAAGQIAPTGDMKIQTPVATMGIRGTAPTVNIDSETGEVNFSIIANPDDGHVGTYTLYNLDNGLPIGTVSSVGTKWQLKSANGQIIELEKSETDLLNDANAVGQINNIYSQWQSSTQQNPDGPQAGPENSSPPSGGLNTNPQNPDAPGADGNTGNPDGEGEGDGQPPPQGNEQQSGTPPPPPPTDTNNQLPPPPPPPTEASGPNIINGTPEEDLLVGTPDDDIIDGLGDDDTIDALAGNDVIIIGPDSGVDIIDGGEGTDTILFEGDLDIDTETFEGEVDNIEIVDLNKTDENTLTISADDINGLNENKILQIRGGTNTDETTDTLNLTSTIFNDENELVEGSWQQLQGVLRVINGISFDVFEFLDGEDNVLATAEVERGIDVTLGETVIGTDESEELQGGEGFDIVNALGGDDTIIGGSGEGDDAYDGGPGNDTISYTSTSQGIIINLVDGTVSGSEIGFDTIVNLQNFVAGSGDDTFIFAADTGWSFEGGGGFDTVRVEGDLDIDTATFESDAEHIEAIDLNDESTNTLTISVDDFLNPEDPEQGNTLQILGGTTDTVNLTNVMHPYDLPEIVGAQLLAVNDGPPSPGVFEGRWQLLEIPPDGTPTGFDVWQFIDDDGVVLATAQIEQGIDVNTPDNGYDLPDGYTGALGANASASDSLPVVDANYNSPEPNLSDYWLFYAIAGQEVTVQVGRDESALDPALWLFKGLVDDPSAFGSVLDFGDPGFIDFADDEIQHPGPFGDPTTTFIAPETGFYTAIVTNFASGADDGDGAFPYTIQVSGNADLPSDPTLLEGFENGFAPNEWETENATISSENSTEGNFSAHLTTTTGNESDPVDGGDDAPGEEGVPLIEDSVRTNAQEIADLAGVDLDELDSLAETPDSEGFVTEGSAIANSFHALEGQVFSFDWFFSTYEYIEDDHGIVNDFAFVVIDGEVFKLFDAEAAGNPSMGLATEGWNTFSIVVDNSDYYDIAFGVLDNEDVEVESSLFIDNLRLGSNAGDPHLMGGNGNDILVGGEGDNFITTGLGADRIIFGDNAESINTITDFGSQDTLDLTRLLEDAFDPDNDNINDFVQATTNQATGETTVAVDIDGPEGPAQFADIAILQGIGSGIGINVSIGDEDTSVTSAAIVV